MGIPLGAPSLILAPTFTVCLVPYSTWIMNRLRDRLCKALNTKHVMFCVVTTEMELLEFLSLCISLLCYLLKKKLGLWCCSFKLNARQTACLIVACEIFQISVIKKKKMQLNSKTLKKIFSTSLEKYYTWRVAAQQSQQSALLFQDSSRPHSTDKTHVGAEPTNLDTRWALWPSPGTPPTACKPTQHDGYLCVSAEIVAGIIAPPVQVRGSYS